MFLLDKQSNLYLRFLNLVRAVESGDGFPSLDVTEEKLLQNLALAWASENAVTVMETMKMDAEMSPRTVHRRLKSLSEKGLVALQHDEEDSRVKYVVPTALSTEYFAKLSACMAVAAKRQDA